MTRRGFVVVAIFSLVLVMVAMGKLLPKPPLSSFYSSSIALYDDQGRLLRLTTARDERYRLWVPLKRISPSLIKATLLHEDRWFRWHPGVNPVALVRGGWRTYVSGVQRQGGSTLTMQLARLHWRFNSQIGRAHV